MPDERSAPGTFPVVRSLLSTTALAEVIGAAYGLDEPRCRLIKATSRDVYRVDTRQGPSVLAVYRHDRRSADQIEAELDVLDDLAERGPSVDVAVAPALRTVTGERLLALAAPEGTRCAVLFRYAQGSSLGIAPDAEVARRYGQLVARVHALTDDWLATSTRARLRPALDATLLVDRSLQGIEGLLRDRPSDLAGLQPVAVLLRRRLAGLPREAPGYGLVHGDVIPQNLLVASDGRLTLLDFDFSGPGWRVFDVATYLWDVRSRRAPEAAAREFLAGYQEVRPLDDWEQAAIPLFAAVRGLFRLGNWGPRLDEWGTSALPDDLFERQLARIRADLAQPC